MRKESQHLRLAHFAISAKREVAQCIHPVAASPLWEAEAMGLSQKRASGSPKSSGLSQLSYEISNKLS